MSSVLWDCWNFHKKKYINLFLIFIIIIFVVIAGVWIFFLRSRAITAEANLNAIKWDFENDEGSSLWLWDKVSSFITSVYVVWKMSACWFWCGDGEAWERKGKKKYLLMAIKFTFFFCWHLLLLMNENFLWLFYYWNVSSSLSSRSYVGATSIISS